MANFDVLAASALESGATSESDRSAPAAVLLSSNQQLLAPPGDLKVPLDAVVTAVVGLRNADGASCLVLLRLRVWAALGLLD